MSLFTQFKHQIEQFNQEAQAPHCNHQPRELGRRLYLLTRHFLDTYKIDLTAEEKGNVLEEYIKAWARNRCFLDIKDTEYAESYKQSSFGKYNDCYNEHCPMTAGFNLSGARLKSVFSDLIFVHVNFNGADFSNLTWTYTHFENCLMSQIKTTPKTNLNQSKFVRCTINSNDLTTTGLCEASFNYCSLTNTKLPGWVWKWQCTDKAPYPSFLQQLQIPIKKLTTKTVANALWLADKSPDSTSVSKSQFSLWAKSRALPFSMQDIEDCLAHQYEMK